MRIPGYSAGSVFQSSSTSARKGEWYVSEVCECAGACYLQTWCLGPYCFQVTVCDPCAYTFNCKTFAAPS
jgi:hypothetical protein